MLKYTENTFSFYKYRGSYIVKPDNVTREIFTDNKDDIVLMVNTYPDRFTDLVVEEIVPTVEQTKRLKEVNEFNIDHPDNYISDFTTYVRYGILTNQDPKLNELALKAKDETVKFLVDELKPAIKKIRDAKSIGGVESFGRKFDSDSLAKENITGYVTLGLLDVVATGRCDRMYDWKDYDNQFAKLTYEQICQLAKLIAGHIQACFSAEALTHVELAKLSVEDLVKFEPTSKYDRIGREVKTEVDHITGKTVTTVEYADLAKIYNECYTLALDAIMRG